MEQGAVCAVCGNVAFDLLDGLYFCSDCGTQSQDVREEVTDATGEAGESVGFLRQLRSSTKKKAVEGGSPSIKQEGEATSQLEVFQLILQKQCDAMVSLGVDPSIKEAVRLLWFHYLKHYGYAFADSKTGKSTPRRRQPQKLTSPYIPAASEKKRCVSTPSGGSTKTEHSGLTKESHKMTADGATPKKRGRGRPRKEFSELRSKSAKQRRPDEAAQYAAELALDGSCSGGRSAGNRKRPREDSGEVLYSKAKRIKMEKGEEEYTFDVFPCDDHLFSPSQDAELAGEEEDSTSGSDSVKELTGVELFLHRRRETQVVIGNAMLSFFSLKYTICLCYLGLLYINHNVLLADLVRWTLLNKVPYHNLATVLPRSVTANTDVQIYVAIVPLTSDRVYQLAKALHSHLKLPPLPALDLGLVCHTIIDRLKLSPCFHSLLDKALQAVYQPSSVFRYVDLRFDGECMALVLILMRLVYKLDDVCEFNHQSQQWTTPAAARDQPSTSQSTTTEPLDQSPSSGMILYPWGDWVVLYLRGMRETLSETVPINERELEYVSNYQKYVDFCRVEIFQATRPPPQDWFRRTVYNPEYYAKLSEIFRRYHSRIEQKVKVKSEHGPVGSSTYEDAPVASGTNNEEQLPAFTPRQLSLSQMLRDPLAPWRDYIPLRGSQSSRGVRHGHLAGIHLSHSMTFLLDAGAQLIDIRPEELYEHLLKVETSFVDTVTTRLKKIDALVSNT